MPKHKSIARLERRLAREQGTRDAIAALSHLIANPPAGMPEHLVALYRNQIALHPPRVGLTRTRACSSHLAAADPRPMDGPDEARNGAKDVHESGRKPERLTDQ